MKKIVSVILILTVLSLTTLSGCTNSSDRSKTIVVGASPTPHAEILKQAIPLMQEKGYELKVKEFSDFVLPNLALRDKELDANYFQHKPYLDQFNVENNTTLISVGAIHYEPFGIYAGRTKSLSEVKEGMSIAVPNDASNEARALLLLQDQGLIHLRDGAGITATVKDISENPKNLQIKEIEAAQLVRSLPDVDFAIINGNYAIQGGLLVQDALAREASESLAATTYANIIAVRQEDEKSEGIETLVEILKSDSIKQYIENHYSGAVLPAQ